MPKITYTTSDLVRALRSRNEGKTYDQIAKELGRHVSTVKYWVGLAREKEAQMQEWAREME